MTRSLARLRELLDIADVNEIAKHRRAARNRTQKARWDRFRADYPGMPHYYRSVLEFAQAWIEARRRPGWERVPLGELVHLLRDDAVAALGEDGEQLKNRGVARILRQMGVTVVRLNDGQWVERVWERRLK